MQTWTEKVILFVWCGFSYVFLLSPMVVVMGASLHGGEFSAAIKFPPDELFLSMVFKNTNRTI